MLYMRNGIKMENLKQILHQKIQEIKDKEQEIEVLQKFLLENFKGKKIRIISDWNGQQFGTSKPSKKGKIYTIDLIGVYNGKLSVFTTNFNLCGLYYPKDFEFVEDQEV